MLTSQADSSGYIDDAVQGLSQGTVWVSPEVKGGPALDEVLTAQVGDASVGVAVFSSNAALEASGPDIVAALVKRTHYDTIVVAVGDDLSAGSRTLDAGEAMRIANQAESQGGGLQTSLTETVQEVVAVSKPVDQDAAAGGTVVFALVMVVALVIAAAGVTWGIARARRTRRRDERGLPAEIRSAIDGLRALAVEYARAGEAGNAVAASTAVDLDTIVTNTTELFARLERKSDDGQRALATLEYDDKLRKLSAAVGRDYLLDILQSPHLWDDPDARVREVREAVGEVSAELLQNIKEINASRGLHFQVSLDGLIGSRKELQEWDREFGEASGDGTA